MKDEKEQKRKARGPKMPLPEDKSLGDSVGAQAMNPDSESDLPDEWISIAAYYIWKNDGEPEGRDVEYWERAKAELLQLRKDGNLPFNQPSEREILEEER
jgi:hypothetical protein